MSEISISSYRNTANSDCEKDVKSVIQREIRVVSKKTMSISVKNLLFSRLTEKECNLSGGVIHFTVMDHDLMWSNDFEGEAFLDMSKVIGIPNESSSENRPLDELRQIELALTHPKGL